MLSETQKKSIESQVQANHLQRIGIEIKIQRVKKAAYPERKSPHCVQVRSLRASRNGLASSTFSFFGRRFRRKYGTIRVDRIECESLKGEAEAGRVDPGL